MTMPDAKIGAVIVLGHPANGVTATKQADGRWTVNTSPHRVVDAEDVARLGREIYSPGEREEKP